MLRLQQQLKTRPQTGAVINRAHPLGNSLDCLWLCNEGTEPVDVIKGVRSIGGSGLSTGIYRDLGRVIVGNTNSGTAFTIRPSVVNYPYVAVTYFTVNVNNGWRALDQFGVGSFAQLSVNAAGNAVLTLRRNFGTARTISTSTVIPVDTAICAIAIVRSDTDYRLYANGEQAVGGLSFGTGGTWLTTMTPVGNTLSGSIALVGYGSGHGLISDEAALQITANPNYLWDIFQPRNIWVPQSISSGNVFTITPSGGISFSGAAAQLRTRAQIPSGGPVFSGTAPFIRTRIQNPTGTVNLAGTASITFVPASSGTTYTITPSGGFAVSGTVSMLRTRTFNPTNGVAFSGVAAITRVRAFTPVGGVVFSGIATTVHTRQMLPVGGVTFNGAAGLIFIPAGGLPSSVENRISIGLSRASRLS